MLSCICFSVILIIERSSVIIAYTMNKRTEAAMLLGRLAAKVNKAKGREYFVELGKKSAAKRAEKLSTERQLEPMNTAT